MLCVSVCTVGIVAVTIDGIPKDDSASDPEDGSLGAVISWVMGYYYATSTAFVSLVTGGGEIVSPHRFVQPYMSDLPTLYNFAHK